MADDSYIGKERSMEERVSLLEYKMAQIYRICPPGVADNSIYDTVTARSKRRGRGAE